MFRKEEAHSVSHLDSDVLVAVVLGDSDGTDGAQRKDGRTGRTDGQDNRDGRTGHSGRTDGTNGRVVGKILDDTASAIKF